MKKIKLFFYQSHVLILRSLKMILNNRKQMLLYLLTPVLTVLLVCLVAVSDMYAIKPENDNRINDGYPVLNWEKVTIEKASDDGEATEKISAVESAVSIWNGKTVQIPTTPIKIGDEYFFPIASSNQLAFLSKAAENGYQDYLTYNYILQCDIDLKSHSFTPIGTEEHPFTGTFDGNGHIISNLNIDSEKDNVGLFGYIESKASENPTVTVKDPLSQLSTELTFYHNGLIKNFQIKNAVVKSSGENVGVAVGTAANRAIITNVSVKGGSVYAKGGNVGGLVGNVNSDIADIYICYSTAEVTTQAENAGGLVGELNSSRISGCYSVCQINDNGETPAENIGTIVGHFKKADNIFKNNFYDNEVNTDYKAVSNTDYEGVAYGISTETLKRYSSELVPFKNIMTEHELLNMFSDEAEKSHEQNDYDPETDEDILNTYSFKKDGQIMESSPTQTGLLILVCLAIFVGTCNSIQEICKEKSILKREYMTNLNLGSYVTSKLVVQALLCAVQMLIVVIIFMLSVRNEKELPTSGALFGSIWTEYFVSLFLLAFAADTTALIISALVKTPESSSSFIAVVLITHIIFSNVLFKLKGVMKTLSCLLPSKWGYEALAISTVFNDTKDPFFVQHPDLHLQFGNYLSTSKPDFINSGERLLMIWGILLLYSIVTAVICRLLLRRIKHGTQK